MYTLSLTRHLAAAVGLALLFGSTDTAAFQPFSSRVQEFEVKHPQQGQLMSSDVGGSSSSTESPSANLTLVKRNLQRMPTAEERDEEAKRRRARVRERRTRAREALAQMSREADHSTVGRTSTTAKQQRNTQPQRLTQEQFQDVQRRTSWFGNSGSVSYNAALGYLADPSGDYDKWAQAYRMLGAFVDCDHDKDAGSGDGGGYNNGNGVCSRWMMWAAYVNPNYQGYGYDEYFGDEPYSQLDCQNPDTQWQLLGVYRQEFYQYIEQISKHLWAIDDYEYVVARAGLMYMTDYECYEVGEDSSGNSIKAAIQPLSNGKFQMGLYTDDYCLTPNDSVGTYDDYVGQTDVDLGSKDQGDAQADDLYDWWYDTQEYTLTNLNDVYEEFMYCTPCMDYPTYQDGYFIGDYGTDDDDIINQCWKFHSHDSYICEAECIAMGHAQGSINQVIFGDKAFGSKMSSSAYTDGSHSKADVLVESSWSRIMANAFLTFSFLLFVATFLAFAVARRSRYRESRSSKSRRLLDDGHMDDHGGPRSVRSRRSRSRKNGGSGSKRGSSRAREGDGLLKMDGGDAEDRRSSSRRSKSRSGSKSRRSKSGSKKRSSSRSGKNNDTSDPPSRKHEVHEDNF